jgi:hypothetical protein
MSKRDVGTDLGFALIVSRNTRSRRRGLTKDRQKDEGCQTDGRDHHNNLRTVLVCCPTIDLSSLARLPGMLRDTHEKTDDPTGGCTITES